jgi:hypothetical protein
MFVPLPLLKSFDFTWSINICWSYERGPRKTNENSDEYQGIQGGNHKDTNIHFLKEFRTFHDLARLERQRPHCTGIDKHNQLLDSEIPQEWVQ